MDCSDWSNLDDDVLIWKNQKHDRYASCVMQKGYVIFDAREEAVVVSQIHLTQECNLWGANPQKWWRRGMKSCVNKSYICYMHLGYVMLFSFFLHLKKKKKKVCNYPVWFNKKEQMQTAFEYLANKWNVMHGLLVPVKWINHVSEFSIFLAKLISFYYFSH